MDRRNSLQSLLALGVAGAVPAAWAQGGFNEGRHFQRLASAVPSSAPAGKLEVFEFFSYGCPHCAAFEPVLGAWVKKLPADVVFRRIPVPFLSNAENYQRLYFSLEAMGAVEAVQTKIFEAVHVKRERLFSVDAMADLVGRLGQDKAKFLEAFNSFGIGSKVKQAGALSAAYQLESVPTLGVVGKYVTSPAMASSEGVPPEVSSGRAIQVVEMLLARQRKGG